MTRLHWRTCFLGDLIELKRGYDLPTSQRKEGLFPIVSSSGTTGTHVEAKVKGPGVVTGRYGTLGEVFYISNDFWPLNTSLYVRDFKGNDPRFIAYLLKQLDLGTRNSAGAVPGVNRNHLHQLPISAPSVSTQRRIASILSAYDDLIENNTRRIAVLEEMARRIYEEWFVQFRFPGHEECCNAGELPPGWREGTLQDVVVLQRGFDLPAKSREPGDYPVFAATGRHGTHAEAKVKGPGIVTGRSGSLGTVIYVEEEFWPLNTTLWGKQFPLGSPLFAFFLLNAIDLKGFNSGAAVPTLNRNDIHKLPTVLPSRQIVRKFDEFMQPIFDQNNVLRRKNTNLRAQRDLLLPKLISGEIDVSNLPLPGTEDAPA